MTLFQNSVLRNHLENINNTEVRQAFEVYKKEFLPKIANIKAQIDTTDKQIDEMVYALYGLSEAEVAVVES